MILSTYPIFRILSLVQTVKCIKVASRHLFYWDIPLTCFIIVHLDNNFHQCSNYWPILNQFHKSEKNIRLISYFPEVRSGYENNEWNTKAYSADSSLTKQPKANGSWIRKRAPGSSDSWFRSCIIL